MKKKFCLAGKHTTSVPFLLKVLFVFTAAQSVVLCTKVLKTIDTQQSTIKIDTQHNRVSGKYHERGGGDGTKNPRGMRQKISAHVHFELLKAILFHEGFIKYVPG